MDLCKFNGTDGMPTRNARHDIFGNRITGIVVSGQMLLGWCKGANLESLERRKYNMGICVAGTFGWRISAEMAE